MQPEFSQLSPMKPKSQRHVPPPAVEHVPWPLQQADAHCVLASPPARAAVLIWFAVHAVPFMEQLPSIGDTVFSYMQPELDQLEVRQVLQVPALLQPGSETYRHDESDKHASTAS